MLEKKFKKILDVNIHYSNGLSKWAQNTENLNDDALLEMLQNLMKEYQIQTEILLKKLKFEKEMYKRKRKFEEKSERVELSHSIRKTKFEIKRKNKHNRKLFKLFKKKIKIDLNNEYTEKEQEFNAYLESLSPVNEDVLQLQNLAETETNLSDNECQGQGEG